MCATAQKRAALNIDQGICQACSVTFLPANLKLGGRLVFLENDGRIGPMRPASSKAVCGHTVSALHALRPLCVHSDPNGREGLSRAQVPNAPNALGLHCSQAGRKGAPGLFGGSRT